MKKMTHKEEMEYLKKYNPILYSELTSDPCGTDSSGDGFMFGIALLVFGIIGSAIFLILV